MLDTIARQSRPALGWQARLAGFHPQLGRWLSPCVTGLPEVVYDPEYGYPISVRYRGDTCADSLSFRADTRLKVEQFRPLP
jgi:hypothetical protein